MISGMTRTKTVGVSYDTCNLFTQWIEYNYPVDECIDSDLEDETDVMAARRLRGYACAGSYPRNVQIGINSHVQRQIRESYLQNTGALPDRRVINIGAPLERRF
jgi:hypothetical protein